MTVKIIDKGWNAIKSALTDMNDSYVKVGFVSGGKHGYKNHSDVPATKSKAKKVAKGNKSGDIDLASLAAVHEYGTSKIPERPFMRQAFDKKNRDLTQFTALIVKRIGDQSETVHSGLSKLGVWMQGKVRLEIAQGSFAALAPATARAKGDPKPLIDTGRMRQAVDFEVVS